MHAKVDHTSAARKPRIPEPAGAGAVGIMKREIGGKNVAELACTHVRVGTDLPSVAELQ